jgi:hypothetical protein
MDSKSIYRTTNASRAAVEDMNIHHHCLDVTGQPREILPYVSLEKNSQGCPLLRASNDIDDPSKLAYFSSLGRALMLG